MRALSALLIAFAGCSSIGSAFKAVESGAYDKLAASASWYCEKLDELNQTRTEARREVRQRGHAGPEGPVFPVLGLDEHTANGKGPVLRIWCAGEEVPALVWGDFVRDWRD